MACPSTSTRCTDFGAGTRSRQHLLNSLGELIGVERLLNGGLRPEFALSAARFVGRHDDHRNIEPALAKLAEAFAAIHHRHLQVEHNRVDGLLGGALKRACPIFSGYHTIPVAAQHEAEHPANSGVVLDHKHRCPLGCRRSLARGDVPIHHVHSPSSFSPDVVWESPLRSGSTAR